MATAMDGPSILALVADPSGCSLWRVWQPFAHLQRRHAYPAEWDWKDARLLETVAPAFDAYLLPRISWAPRDWPAAARWFDAMRRAGKTVIYEADDDLFSPWIVQHQRGGGAGSERPPEVLEAERLARVAALRRCDAATVSTQRLATVVRQWAPGIPVAVVPNAIDLRWFRAVQRAGRRVVPGLTVGWAGGARPDADLEAMAVAWGQLCQRYPHVTFVVQGHQPKVLHDQVPPHRLRALPWLPPESYPLGLRNVDIGCCPLADAPFNRNKSPIKAWEYAAGGAAVVASPTVYRHTIAHGEDGLLCATAGEWEDAIAALIEDAARRRALARRLRRRVARDHSLETQAWRWPAAWAALVGQSQAKRATGLWLPEPARVAGAAVGVA